MLFSRERWSTYSSVFGTLKSVSNCPCAFIRFENTFRKSGACSLCSGIYTVFFNLIFKRTVFETLLELSALYVASACCQIEGERGSVERGKVVREYSFENDAVKIALWFYTSIVSYISAEMLNILTGFSNGDNTIKSQHQEHVQLVLPQSLL